MRLVGGVVLLDSRELLGLYVQSTEKKSVQSLDLLSENP